jgi:DNA polymerase-4
MPILIPGRWVLHLDVDAFFAAVEQRDNPRLRGRPVAVGTGVVASCSYEAKQRGVGTGMRLSEARRIVPDLVVLPGDYRRYELSARRILGISHDHTPLVEMAALDDLYLDLGPLAGGLPEPHLELARQLAEQVREEVGLAVSLGLGTSKVVAGVATLRVKRRKARGLPAADVECVLPGTEAGYLAPWPVEVLPGVGPRLGERLERLNVRRVGELAAVPLSVLAGLFGRRGQVLRDLARGIDHRSVEPFRPPQSVSRRTSFEPALGDLELLSAMLDHLLDRAVSWLRVQGLGARGLTVSVRYGDQRSADSRVSFPRPTDDEQVFRAAARQRWARLLERRLPLRLLGVELSPVQPLDGQGVLFEDPETQRRRRLRECQEAIRARFGFLSLVSGSTLVLREHLEHDRENFRLRTPCLTR